MAVIEIRKAKREGARLVIGIAGVSGSGKTFSAIQLAYGLANYNPAKVGFLDTENRRGSLYADILEKSTKPTKEEFLIGDLYAPFSPERYIQAVMEFQRAGVEVLVIDSATHEYEGTGGIQEIAEAGNPKMPNWNKAKAEHKRFMNAMLQCNMHIIFCVRAREKASPERVDGKTVYKDLGLQPIQEKNFMFEMTASLMMHDQGFRQDVMKCPAQLQGILGRGEGYITADDGKALRDWVDGAHQLDPEVERCRNMLISVTEQGIKALGAAWNGLTPAIKTSLGETFKESLKSSAAEYDRLRAESEATSAEQPVQAAAAAIMAAAAKGRERLEQAHTSALQESPAAQPTEQKNSNPDEEISNLAQSDSAESSATIAAGEPSEESQDGDLF